MACWRSSKEMGRCDRTKSPDGKRASGGRPRSMTTSTSAGSSGWVSTRRRSSPGRSSRSRLSSSSDPSAHAAPPASPCAARRGRPPRRVETARVAIGRDATQECEARRREGGRAWGGCRERRRQRWSGGAMGGAAAAGEAHEWREIVAVRGEEGPKETVVSIC